jgi:hypothetical protein
MRGARKRWKDEGAQKTRTDLLQRVVEFCVYNFFVTLAFDQLCAVHLLLQCCAAHQAQASLEVSVSYFDLGYEGGKKREEGRMMGQNVERVLIDMFLGYFLL